jgi:hypothetical protein
VRRRGGAAAGREDARGTAEDEGGSAGTARRRGSTSGWVAAASGKTQGFGGRRGWSEAAARWEDARGERGELAGWREGDGAAARQADWCSVAADERPSAGIARLAGCGLRAARAAEDADPTIGRIVEEEGDAKLALGRGGGGL